jgi:hypothetical protein
MAAERSRSSNGLSHRQFRSNLCSFRPAEAAFVLHLARCQQCRGVASRLLGFDGADPAPGDFPGGLDPVERDILLDLTRGGFLLSLVEAAFSARNDLPPTELRRFLEALSPEQLALIRHLLDCESCRKTAAKTLAPKDRPARPSEAATLSLAAVPQ